MSIRPMGSLLMVMMLVGCQARLSVFSPRRTNTEAHREATDAAMCLKCHDAAAIKRHKADDACLDCHVLCAGC